MQTMTLNRMVILLVLTIGIGCSNKKKEEGPPPPPPTVPLESIKGSWGAVSGGLSLHAHLPKNSYAPGEPVIIRVAIGNFAPSPRTFPAIISEPRTILREELIILQSTIADPPSAILPPRQAYLSMLHPLRLAPGTYRLRVILDGPERSADQTPAWHGRLVSTDLTLTVTPPP